MTINETENLNGAAQEGSFIAVDGNKNIINPSHAIFPIIKHDRNGFICLIGTGFFIAENGLFLTAKHVLMDVLDDNGNQTHAISLVQFLEGSYVIRPILKCSSHEVADISVGISAPMASSNGKTLKNKLIKLTSNIGEVGKGVFTYAYPKTVIKHSAKQTLHFNVDYYKGFIQKDYPNGRDKILLPGACFQTSMYIHGGASGGPVFNDEGVVCGVNSTGYENEPLSFITPINTIVNLVLNDVGTPNNSTGQISIQELINDKFILYDDKKF